MKAPVRVLVVEDEAAIAELIAVNLRHNGFAPTLAGDGQAAQAALETQLPALILLDWMLPGESGIALAQRWREQERTRNVPIIMLTARTDERDKISGLDAGADDYITKPFSTQELLARIRAVLRRHAAQAQPQLNCVGAVALDADALRVTVHGREVKLGPTELKLLQVLMRQPDRVLSREALLNRVWGHDSAVEERTVDVHIKRLREALAEAGAQVQTVRGAGYRFAAQGDPA